MGYNRKLILGAVLLVGGLIFWGLMKAFSGANRVAAAPTPVPVVQPVILPNSARMIAYAASEIPQGALVTKNMLTMRELPGSAPTTPFVTDPASQAVGFVTSTRIPKGKLIQPSDDFAGHISQVGVAGMLRPNTRAIVIPFANKPTLHDLVAIGDRVDINAAFDGQEARTIVPNVRVLAVDVFGADFPQVNIARRGAFRADLPSAPAPVVSAAPGAAAAPGATPTPTPSPAPGGARPDPSMTLEVAPDQANRILLAQASGAVLDFVVLPARGDAVLVDSGPGTLVGDQSGGVGGLTTISAVTRPQIAPYAERKKAAGGGAAGTRTAAATRSGSGTSAGSGGRASRTSRLSRVNETFGPPPVIPKANSGGENAGGSAPYQPLPALPPAESPTYNIPIYADGRVVRVETVPRPQD